MYELLTIVELVLGMMLALTLVAYILATTVRMD